MRRALVLRPEPGNAETAARLAAAGIAVSCQPLFAVAPAEWRIPDPTRYNALLLTSGNAARHAGIGLAALAGLPAMAVGEATATAARAAGLRVVLTGDGDVLDLVETARAQGWRLLHLAGAHRVALPGIDAVTVYRSTVRTLAPGVTKDWRGQVALLHSARAARRFGALVDRHGVDRASIAIAALSKAVAAGAAGRWEQTVVADLPTDTALVACAAALIDRPGDAVDKRTR